jgi:hypothetical protein
MTGVQGPSWTATAPAFVPQPVQPAPGGDPFSGRPERDTIAVGSAEPADDTDGIGGLFASAEPVDPPAPAIPPVPPAGSHTAVMTAPPQWDGPQWDAPPVAPDPAPAGLSRQRGILLAGAVVLVLVLVSVGALLILSATGKGNDSASGPKVTGATHSAAASLALGRTQAVDGVTFTLRASRVDTTCIGHSYGQVAAFFGSTGDCTGLSRALYSADVGGHPMVVAISHVRMPTAERAQALRALADTSGTGNVSDLLREGVRYDGGPERLVLSEYSSQQQGDEVTIVETSWVDQAHPGTADQLDVEANSGLVLKLQPLPGR